MNATKLRLRDLADVVDVAIRAVHPGWFTSIMGTGILAICMTISPITIPAGRAIGLSLWTAAAIVFALCTTLLVVNIAAQTGSAARTLADPAKAQLWGAPPMACFTIAVGCLKIGPELLPLEYCVAAAQVLFVVGVIGSIAVALIVPYFMFTQHELAPGQTAGSWLLPVVPPIVASVPGALLSSTWPRALRSDLLALDYALLGLGMMLAAILIVIFYSRLVYHKVPAGALVTTTWLVVGPLGQSIAGIIALGSAATSVWPQFGSALMTAGLVYGVLGWGFALYWLAMAFALTLRAVYRDLPFTLGWWAFTFPVGVLTVGTDALYTLTRADIFAICALGLTALLAVLWTVVAAKTLSGALGAATNELRSGQYLTGRAARANGPPG